MDVPRLTKHVSYAPQLFPAQNVLLHLALLEVIHVDVNAIYAIIQLLSLTLSRLSSHLHRACQ